VHRLAPIVIALLALLAWVAAVWGPGDHWAAAVPRDVKRAQDTLRSGDPAGALAQIDAMSPTASGLVARLVAGNAALLVGDPARAQREFEAAVAIDAGSSGAWLGRCLVGGMQGGDASGACARALDSVQDRSECAARMARALGSARSGDVDAAQAELTACAAAEPDNPGPGQLRPLLATVAGDPEARAAFAAVVLRGATDGGDPRARAMDEVRERLGEEDAAGALAALDAAQTQWGAGVEVDVLRAQALHQRGDSEAARALLLGMVSSLPGDSRLAGSACVLAADLEAHAQAESLCAARASASRGDERCAALHALGQSRLNRGLWARAEEALARCLEQEPSNAGIWADAAVAAAALGHVDAAIERLRVAEGLEPGSVDAAAFDDERAFAAFKADPRGAEALARVGR